MTAGLQWSALIAILISTIPFIIYARKIAPNIESDDEFYLASDALSSRSLFETLMATWLLLGNVIVAAMYLGGLLGWVNWWMIITWGLGFWFVGRHANTIKEQLGETKTLHTYLKDKYSSNAIKTVASVVTLIVSLGIIALELIVGMALVVIFSKDPITPVIFGLLLAIAISYYCYFGGLTAVINSDKLQFYGILAAFFVVLFIAFQILEGPLDRNSVPVTSYDFELGTALSVGWPFYVGLFLLQVPLLLGDFGTWQRVRASKKETDSSSLRKTFFRVGLLNIVLWSILVFAGVAVATIKPESIPQYISNSQFYASAQPIIDLIQIAVSGLIGISNVITIILVFFIMLGMILALMSSADSYLLIALQTWTTDINKVNEVDNVERGRRLALLFMLIALCIAYLTIYFQISIVSAVFILFGSQTVVAPLALYALREDINLTSFSKIATISAILGFLFSIGYGLWSTFISDSLFHKMNGAYLCPVIGFLVPFLSLLFFDLYKNGCSTLQRLFNHVLVIKKS